MNFASNRIAEEEEILSDPLTSNLEKMDIIESLNNISFKKNHAAPVTQIILNDQKNSAFNIYREQIFEYLDKRYQNFDPTEDRQYRNY